MAETPTFGRYAEIPYDQMTPEQKEGYDFAVKTRGPLGGPNKIWVHNPKLAKVAAPFGGHFHAGNYSLTEREREIAVIVINSKWHSAYPTAAHERRGKEMGLPADKVEALLSGLPTSFDDKREQVVYEMAICPSRMRAGCRKEAPSTARSRRSAMSASPTRSWPDGPSPRSVSMTLCAFYDVPAGAQGIAR